MQEKAEILHSLPQSGAGLNQLQLNFNGVDLHCSISLTKNDFSSTSATILFSSVSEYRFSQESCAQGCPKEAIDQVCEIINSKWAKTVSKNDRDTRDIFKKRHFAIFLTNHGYLEVIADSFEHSGAA